MSTWSRQEMVPPPQYGDQFVRSDLVMLERRENNHEMSISPHDALVYASLGGNRTVLSPPISDESEMPTDAPLLFSGPQPLGLTSPFFQDLSVFKSPRSAADLSQDRENPSAAWEARAGPANLSMNGSSINFTEKHVPPRLSKVPALNADGEAADGSLRSRIGQMSRAIGDWDIDAPSGPNGNSSNGCSTPASENEGRARQNHGKGMQGAIQTKSKGRYNLGVSQSSKSSRSSGDWEGERVQAEQTACLQGFNPDKLYAPLRYGDSISLVPEGVNGLVVYAGSEDGQPWIETLQKQVSIPPNLRDCQFRLLPSRSFVEAKKLHKFLKNSNWDGGKGLALPDIPDSGVDMHMLAQDFVAQHKLPAEKAHQVYELMLMLRAKEDEIEGNLAEDMRVKGREVKYGNTVSLMHVTSEKFLTVTKNRALEGSSKRVICDPAGSNNSIFIIKPAFKTYSDGSSISSGDLVTFMTNKTISGSQYFLHMSNLQELRDNPSVMRRNLMINHPYIESGQELNAASADHRPTMFRALLFTPLENVKDKENVLKAEDIVSFYHKQQGAYLHYDPDSSPDPYFYQSARVASKSRKKCFWLWKVENSTVLNAGENVCANEHQDFKKIYRIKHLVTNMYLIRKEDGGLGATKLYDDPRTRFCFKHFVKNADVNLVGTGDMSFLRADTGEYVTVDLEADKNDVQASQLSDRSRIFKIKMRKQELLPDSDALMMMPLRQTALKGIVQVRRMVLVMLDFKEQLELLPDADIRQSQNKLSQSSLNKSSIRPEDGVLEVVRSTYNLLHKSLSKLVVNLSWGENPDPMARDGIPNRLLQKILRELKVVQLVVDIVQLPFKKGVSIDMVAGNDEFKQMVTIINLSYRLLKQMAKQNLANAKVVLNYLDVWRAQLGKGILVTPTIKEIFDGKFELLNNMNVEVIQHFVDLLQRDKAPQYIDFLMSVCVSPEPLAKVQNMVGTELLEKNSHLLPRCKLEPAGNRIRLLVDIPGSNLSALDLKDYKKTVEVRGRTQDYAGWVLNAPLNELNPEQKVLRYFIRCSNMYGRLALGRNQHTLRLLLFNKELCLDYDSLLKIVQESSLPYLVRARFFTLIERLYVDRDPQITSPSVARTRVWSKCVAEESDLDMSVQAAAATIPVCTNGFRDLLAFLLKALPEMADCKNEEGKPSLNGEPRFGQLEMIKAMISICSTLIDFGFWQDKQKSTAGAASAPQAPNYQNLTSILKALFSILETREKPADHGDAAAIRRIAARMQKAREDQSIEARMRNDVRQDALKLVMRIFDARLNARITFCVQLWERIFQSFEDKNMTHSLCDPENLMSVMSVTSAGSLPELTYDHERLKALFGEFAQDFKTLARDCFNANIVSPDEIGCDVYNRGDHDDATVQIMLDLSGYGNNALTSTALSLLLRNMSQRNTTVVNLKDVQLLVFPVAAKVFAEANFVIQRFSALQKLIAAEKQEAYEEVSMLLTRLTGYLTERVDNKQEIVAKNQSILLNVGVDRTVRNMLGLYLGRDSSRCDQGLLEADIPSSTTRRDLFQDCYTFLKMLARKNLRAQAALFPHLKTFVAHMGIEKLNVSDTIAEVVRDNVKLASRVEESLFRNFIVAITKWGRRARWLSFFQVFIFIKDRPVKRNQDLILRLLMDEKEAVLDFDCDYSRNGSGAKYLSANDERFGKTRIQLLLENEHRRPVFSLLKYHTMTQKLLAGCANGKNAENQVKIGTLVQLEDILKNILDVDKLPDGTRETRINADALRFVREAWITLLTDIIFQCQASDSHTIQQVAASKRIFNPPRATRDNRQSLMDYFTSSLSTLDERLSKLNPKDYVERPNLLDGVEDEFGNDLGMHYREVTEILRGSKAFFSRWDVFVQTTVPGKEALFKLQSQALRDSAVHLYTALDPFRFESVSQQLIELITNMSLLGIDGVRLQVKPSAVVEKPALPPRERCFQEGWLKFRQYLPPVFGIDGAQGQGLNLAIKDMAILFGSTQSHRNNDLQSLQQVMMLLCQEDCDDVLKLTGLKMLRAMMYMMPNSDVSTTEYRNAEYDRHLLNLPPSGLGNKQFHDFQTRVAKLGCLDVILRCIESEEPDVIYATLQLAVTILDGGNPVVQRMLGILLTPASSMPFFARLKALFIESKQAMKDAKRKIKQAAAEKAAMMRAGIVDRKVTQPQSLASGQKHMAEVMKAMRRMCMAAAAGTGDHTAVGSNKVLQDVLRYQKLNFETSDFFIEAIHYIETLEPDIPDAVQNKDFEFVDVVIRGFLMLADAMSGPNRQNQQSIADSGCFDLCDRILARVRFEEMATALEAASARMPGGKLPPGKPQEVLEQNDFRSKLKLAIGRFLLMFLDGVADEELPAQMLSLLNWPGVVDQMHECHQAYDRGSDLPNNEVCVEEALQYFFLMTHAKHYDADNEFIAPAFEYLDAEVYEFYAARAGYIEIVRHNLLERVYFPIPDVCREGGLLDRPAVERYYYNTDRIDADRKNKDFLERMCELVEKDEFHSEVRKTEYAFTVTKLDTIRKVNFFWTLGLHTVMVLGGYMPSIGYWTSSFKEDYESTIQDQKFLTKSDVYFYETVQPWIVVICRVMSQINLITCGVRFFAFLWADLPIIINLALSKENLASVKDVPLVEIVEHAPKVVQMAKEEVVWVEEYKSTPPVDPKSLEEDDKGNEDWRDLARRRARAALQSGVFWYEFGFVIFPVLAVATDEPLLSLWSLFEICTWEGSRTILDAIFLNIGKMAQAIVLGLLMIYAWMVFGIMILKDAQKEDTCANLFQCFTSYVDVCIRDTGVNPLVAKVNQGDGGDLKYPHNLWDALGAGGQTRDQGVFAIRFFWDVSFQIFFSYILVAIITGIVIDAFGALKEKREMMEDDLNTVCYICNIGRFKVDQYGIGFDKHIRLEHNPRWYLAYLIYLRRVPYLNLSEQQRYVYDMIWPKKHKKRSTSWMPKEQTFTLAMEDGDHQELEIIHARVEEIDVLMKTSLLKVEQRLELVDKAIKQVDARFHTPHNAPRTH